MANIYLLGGIYFLIANVHPKFNAALNRIFLNTMFYTKDLKHPAIGWPRILESLNHDIKTLEEASRFAIYFLTLIQVCLLCDCGAFYFSCLRTILYLGRMAFRLTLAMR